MQHRVESFINRKLVEDRAVHVGGLSKPYAMIHDFDPLLQTVINKLNQSQVAKQKGPKT